MTKRRPLDTASKTGQRIQLLSQEYVGHCTIRSSYFWGLWQPLTQRWTFCYNHLDKTWEQTADGRRFSLEGNIEIVAWWDPDASEEETPDDDLF